MRADDTLAPSYARVVSKEFACKYLGCSARQLESLLARGVLRRCWLDHRVRIDVRELDALIERSKTRDLRPLRRPPPKRKRAARADPLPGVGGAARPDEHGPGDGSSRAAVLSPIHKVAPSDSGFEGHQPGAGGARP